MLRNLTASVIESNRVETTIAKAKAVKPLVEKMITLGKSGTLVARRAWGIFWAEPNRGKWIEYLSPHEPFDPARSGGLGQSPQAPEVAPVDGRRRHPDRPPAAARQIGRAHV